MKHRNFVTTLFASLFFLAAGSALAAGETPTEAPKGVTIIDAKKAQELLAGGAVLADTRKASEYGEGSIKGAISVPYDPEKSTKDVGFDSKLDKFDLTKFPDKNAKLVIFCNAGSCWKSYKAAVVLAANGYKNVFWYREGVPDWKARKLPME